MKPDVKARLIWSPVGGVLIPTAYFLLFYFLNRVLAPSLPRWVALPLIWPAYIYSFFARRLAGPVSFEEPGLDFWLFWAVANFLFYSLLTYLVIVWKQRTPRLR